jgi:DNA polymerase-1
MEESSFQVSCQGEQYNAFYLTTPDSAVTALARLMAKDVLFGIDTETRALDTYLKIKDAALSPHLSKIRLLQVFDGVSAVVFDMDKIGRDDMFIPFLSTKRFLAHYGLFDLQFFMRLGVKEMNLGCTQILSKLLYSAIYHDHKSASLADLAKAVLQIDITKGMQVSDWSQPDLTFEQIEYAALDPVYCYKIGEKLAPGLNKFNLSRVYNLYKNSQHPLCAMQINGLGVNIELHKQYIEEWRLGLYDSKKVLEAKLGLKEITPSAIAEWLGANLDPQTLMTWPRTETGMLSTDAHTFIDYSYLPLVEPLSVFQKKKILSSTFGHALLDRLNPQTKRLHCRYNIAGARTGRLSSTDPNLQNFPRDKALRKIFVPKDGWAFVCADYSQIEIRVAAEISRDELLLKAYREGLDVYTFTASRISRKPMTEITKMERQKAKALVLGMLYGLGAKKFSHYARTMDKNLEVSSDEAKRVIEIFRETYPGYRKWQMEQVNAASESLLTKTICGKIRKLNPENTYGTAMNTPIQGSSAEIMLYALCYLQDSLESNRLAAKLCNTVHDEILIECPLHEVPVVTALTETAMIDAFKEVFPNGITNNLVGISHGSSWGEAKE